ncbi:MAG: SDR family oxidoreductase [Psychrobium sp.]
MQPQPKIALITGGSRGIGAATARVLAAQGYYLCINYRGNHDAAAELQQELLQVTEKVVIKQADISIEAQVLELFEFIDRELGTITALVNNAGILRQQCRLQDLTAERINQILLTNVTGSFICAREAVKRMSTALGGQGGAIVNVSSAASYTGAPNEYVDYAASKGAMDSMTKGLSLEVAAEGIRVNSVRPGCIYTQMHADGGEAGRVDRLAPLIPMQRGGKPDEVANAIAWLLSDEASYATGTFIDLAGGR